MQIGHGRQGVLIGEYGFYRIAKPTDRNSGIISDGSSSDKNQVVGWMEPAATNPSWIIWFTQQGDALIYRQREDSGAVIGEPIRLAARGLNNKAAFYGPHACSTCAVTICKMGREFGDEIYNYPEGPVYPNSDWIPHICQQRDIERVNGLRSIGFDMAQSEAPKSAGSPAWQDDIYTGPESTEPPIRMYSDSQVRRLLRKAQERGINLDEGSPVEKLTIAELDEMLD